MTKFLLWKRWRKNYLRIISKLYAQFQGAKWLSGRVLDSRPRGCGFEPHRHYCVVSLSKNINPSLVLVQPKKTRPFITERLHNFRPWPKLLSSFKGIGVKLQEFFLYTRYLLLEGGRKNRKPNSCTMSPSFSSKTVCKDSQIKKKSA